MGQLHEDGEGWKDLEVFFEVDVTVRVVCSHFHRRQVRLGCFGDGCCESISICIPLGCVNTPAGRSSSARLLLSKGSKEVVKSRYEKCPSDI